MKEKLIELLHDAFISVSWVTGEYYPDTDEVADHLIANGVTIPVRCKDCKHWECWRASGEGSGNCLLDTYGILWNANDFCSYGERRTDG